MSILINAYIHSNVLFNAHLGKLAVRSQKVAHFLLNKLGGGKQVQPGDRVSMITCYDLYH